jgi:6,7-dimethyl-8-ribityllumazine synthase
MAGAAPERNRDKTTRPGTRRAPAGRFAVVAARFNESISKKLADGAAAALETGGVDADCVEVHWVPGSFELPQAAMALARTGRYAGIVCVGVIIRGETPHFEYLSGAVAHGLSRVGLETGVPVSFGVITALTEAQAWERAGGAVGHRGEEAARAALELAGFMRGLKTGRARPRAR